MKARALFLLIWGAVSFVVFLISPGWGLAVFFIGFLIVALTVSAILRPPRGSGSQDINIHIMDDREPVSGRPHRRSSIQTGLDWHVPKINKDGVEFITGARSTRKSQQQAMRRTKKRLWGD
ncbi:MAG: hypothetical protein H8E40_03685 [Chloroflexi bacterium]|nr:hypothetical protein [Chloroflexota bacterium]